MDEGSVSPKLDLNQAVANENDEEMKGGRHGEDASEGVTTVSELTVSHAAGNGSSLKLSSSPARNGDNSPAQEKLASPTKSSSPSPSPSPARHTLSPPPKHSNRDSRSPSPKKRRSSPAADRSLSRSPDERRGGRSRSPEGHHGRRRDDGRKRHDRSRSPVSRSHHRERSCSWSPRERERERDRYRSRYSPRRRSSPPRHLRGDRSPRKRPWSPPRNRNTGIGKPGNHLFVAGFSFSTTERDLEKKFGRYGRVSDVRIIRDRRSGDSRGFGFLSLERDEEADAAIEGLDQTEWNGRIVLVEKAKTT